MINTAPLNGEAATTMIMGIQVAVGMGPRNLIIRINPVPRFLRITTGNSVTSPRTIPIK